MPIESDLDSVFHAAVPAHSLNKHCESQSSLPARLLQAQDEERRRISRELHDSVGQYLVAILMNLEMLSKSIRDTTLNETIDLVRDVSREVRTVSYLMHPPLLDLSGLDAAITWYAKGFSKRSGITLEVDIVQQVPRLPIEQETAFYRVVQECLTNVHRYSGASKARIRLGINEREFWLEVEDNGKGLATEHLHANPNTRADLGVGIPGMRERMREIGGSLHIQSNTGGTKVRAALSLINGEATANPVGYTACELTPGDE